MPERTLESLGLTRLAHAGPAPRRRTRPSQASPSTAARCARASSSSPSRATSWTARALPNTRCARARAAVVVTPQGLETARADIGELPVPFFLADDPSARARPAGRRLLRAPARDDGRGHGHERQDLGRAVHPPDLGDAGLPGRGAGHDRRFGRGLRGAARHHHARAGGAARAAGAAGGQGLHARGDGGVEPRARAASARRRAAAGGGASRTSAATTWTITRRTPTMLRPRCGSSPSCCRPAATAVLNAGDPVALEARQICVGRGIEVLAVGRGADVALRLTETRFHPDGQEIAFAWRGATHRADLALIGGFQAENVLVAAGLAIATGASPEAVFAALPRLAGVRGRMQRAATRANGAAIYVDYAHTPGRALIRHRGAASALQGSADRRLRRRRRPRRGQAPADGRCRRRARRRRHRHGRQPALRGCRRRSAPRSARALRSAEEIGDRAEAILAGVEALQGSRRLPADRRQGPRAGAGGRGPGAALRRCRAGARRRHRARRHRAGVRRREPAALDGRGGRTRHGRRGARRLGGRRASPSIRARWRRATSSSRWRARTATATASSPRRWRPAPRRRWWPRMPEGVRAGCAAAGRRRHAGGAAPPRRRRAGADRGAGHRA